MLDEGEFARVVSQARLRFEQVPRDQPELANEVASPHKPGPRPLFRLESQRAFPDAIELVYEPVT